MRELCQKYKVMINTLSKHMFKLITNEGYFVFKYTSNAKNVYKEFLNR